MFHAKMGIINDRNSMDLQKQKILRGGGKNTQKNCTKKIFMTQIITIECSFTIKLDILECDEPKKHLYEQR